MTRKYFYSITRSDRYRDPITASSQNAGTVKASSIHTALNRVGLLIEKQPDLAKKIRTGMVILTVTMTMVGKD